MKTGQIYVQRYNPISPFLLGGARGSVVVTAQCYKLEGHGSRPHEVNEFFQFT
jgi:hypothetical protein